MPEVLQKFAAGDKYEMYHGLPSILISRKRWTQKEAEQIYSRGII
jgi:hypothetical protein